MLGATFADPWRFQADPEVYLLVVFLIGAYVYTIAGDRAACRRPMGNPSSPARTSGASSAR